MTTPPPPRYFYGVARGRNPGVYNSWPECQAQVSEFPGARYKKFNTPAEAEHFIHLGTGDYKQGSRGWGVNSVEYPANVSVKEMLISSAKRKARGDHDQSPTTKKQFDAGDALRARLQEIATARDCEIRTTEVVKIYTDGAASCNGREEATAGWSVWFEDEELRHFNESMRLQGPLQTNNRAELMAVIRACQLCPYPEALLEVYTDSQYVISAMEERQQGWRLSGWRMAGPSQGKGEGPSSRPIQKAKHTKNLDLINLLEKEMKARKLTPKLYHVMSHSGNPGNEMADKLAVAGSLLPEVPRHPWVDIEITDSSPPCSEDEEEPGASPTQDIASVRADAQLKARLARSTADRSSPSPSVRKATLSSSLASGSSNPAVFSTVDSEDTRDTCSSSRAPDDVPSSDFEINTQQLATAEELERIERGELSD